MIETVAPVTARYSVPLWARAISSEPWTSNTPPALMSTSSADSLKLDGPMVVVPEPPGLATWMAPVEVLMASVTVADTLSPLRPTSASVPVADRA